MIYLVTQLWPFLVAAVAIGAIAGWRLQLAAARNRGDRT